VYRALSVSERRATGSADSVDALADMAWLTIYRHGTLCLSKLSAVLGASLESTERAVESLVADGLVERCGAESDPELRAENFVIPVNAQRGWEASVFDHFSTACAAIAAKVRGGSGARTGEVIGGATFSFDVYPGHPFQERVMEQLTSVRAEVDALWTDVAAYNRAHPVADELKVKVSFYFGQNVQDRGTTQTGHRAPSRTESEA
jgi:DNA-binding Lrp family transcriptional regulator